MVCVNNNYFKRILLLVIVVVVSIGISLNVYGADSSSSSASTKTNYDKNSPPQARMTDNEGEITRQTYQYTTRIGKIKIGADIKSIEEGSFNNQLYLIAFEVDENNSNYSSFDGVLYDKNQTTLVCFPQGLHAANVPNTVVKIAPGAMYGKSSGLKKQIKALVTANNGGTYPGFDKYVNDQTDPYIVGGLYNSSSSSKSDANNSKNSSAKDNNTKK